MTLFLILRFSMLMCPDQAPAPCGLARYTQGVAVGEAWGPATPSARKCRAQDADATVTRWRAQAEAAAREPGALVFAVTGNAAGVSIVALHPVDIPAIQPIPLPPTEPKPIPKSAAKARETRPRPN